MKFRKKPVVIEAFQFTEKSLSASFLCENESEKMPEWFIESMNVKVGLTDKIHNSHWAEIRTLEGIMVARPDDWIIKGVNGEIYPCKPDIFEKTYEPASIHPEEPINYPTCGSDDTVTETVYRKIVECKKCGDKNYLTDEPEIVHPQEPEGQEEKKYSEAERTEYRDLLLNISMNAGLNKRWMDKIEFTLAKYDQYTYLK